MLDNVMGSAKHTQTCTCSAINSKPLPLNEVRGLAASLGVLDDKKIAAFEQVVAWWMYAKATWPNESERFYIANPRPRIEDSRVISYIEHEMSCEFDSKSRNKLIHLIETSDQAWRDFKFADRLRECDANHNPFNQWPVEVRQLLLRTADLAQADLEEANLSGANLSGAIIENCHLIGADFREACLVGACFNQANLQNASFIGANCKETIFKHTNVTQFAGVDFKNATLDKAKIKIDFPSNKALNLADFQLAFNHRNNQEERSILRTVDSIDSRYASTKVALMEQLLRYVAQLLRNNKEIDDKFRASNISLAFGDVLLQNPLYGKHSLEINAFVQNKLLPALSDDALLERCNNGIELKDVNPLQLEKLATFLTAKLTKAELARGFAVRHRVAINRALTACGHEPSLVTVSDRLYDALHGQPENQKPVRLIGHLKDE